MAMERPYPLKLHDCSGGAFVNQGLNTHICCAPTCSPTAEHQVGKEQVFYTH